MNQRVVIAIIVILVVAIVAFLAASGAKAGGATYKIPAPSGAKFEVRSKASFDATSHRDNGMQIIELRDFDRRAAVQARWYYEGANCYADGRLDSVLSDIEACANKAVRKK